MDWSLLDAYDPFACGPYPAYDDKTQLTDEYLSTLLPPQAQPMAPPSNLTLMMAPMQITREIYTLNPNPRPRAMPLREQIIVQHKGDNPREIRNKAEKQRRDKLNQSIAELAAMVPPVVSSNKKIDKTGVLRLTAHYLRAHQYVFGDAIDNSQPSNNFHSEAIKGLLSMLNGFLMSVTYRGLIVVVSQNVNQYIGHSEADLLGQSIFAITHRDDHILLREQLMPRRNLLGPNGELLVPEEIDGTEKVSEALVNDKRRFMIRVKKLTQRSEPAKYVTCHVEGSFRRADRACGVSSRCCPVVRRARARGDNPCSSGNDIVFIGIIRPTTETFMSESALEAFRMEYRTRHSVDGEIIQCEQRIALVTGYMTHEVNGVNAMNFMHRDDVRWVIIALREMYDQRRLFGESCYRLMTKNGQLIYLRTRGRLDIEKGSKMVTTFVCTNTVVDEEEGKHLIKMMKKKFMILINNNEETPTLEEEPAVAESDENETLPVEDPRQLEKVILHLVTNLPSPAPQLDANSPVPEDMQIAIVPPRKERIVSAIEKMYGVIKTFKRLSDKRLPRIPECPITSTARLSPLDEEVSPTSIQDYFMCRDMESDNPNGNYIEPNRASSSSIISPHLGGSSGERFDRSLPSCSGLTGTKRPNERNMDYIHAIKRTTDKSRDIMDDVLETIEEIPEIDDFIDDTIHIIDDTAETVDAALEVVDNTIETFDTSSNSTFDTVYEPNYISEQPRVDKCINYLELAINPTFPNLLHDDVQEVLRELGDDENELNREQDGNF